MEKKIAVLAFNKVQAEVYNELKKREYCCQLVDLSDLKSPKACLEPFDVVILPFPSKKENIISDFKKPFSAESFFNENQLVIGGMLENEIKNGLESSLVNHLDYFTNEPYVLKNAYLTTQGVMRLLFESTRDFLSCKSALVTGFGRIGKSLAVKLKAVGLKVFVAVRSEMQASEAYSMGFEVLKISAVKSIVFYFDFIFNTVPFNIFQENDVRHMKDETLYFEIASSPYGAKREHFDLYNKQYIPAGALPGKLYPKAVAENICDFICNSDLFNGGVKNE